MVDVARERWNADDLVLTGESRIVADDPYELRIVVPTGENSFLATEVQGDASDLPVSFEQTGPQLRATIRSRQTRTIMWEVRFRRGAVPVPEAPPVTDLGADVSYQAVTLKWQSAGGSRFQIRRSDGQTFEANTAEYRDAHIRPGAKYTYEVRSIGWDGRLSEAARLELRTLDELKLPPEPPRPDISITDLSASSATTGWGKIGANRTCQGERMKLLGKPYDSGVGVHAASTLVYAIPNGARRFVATGGLDDEKADDPRQSVVLRLLGAPDEMGEPPVLLAESPMLCDETLRIWHFDVELSPRYRSIHLVVGDGGDGIACDHVDWVNAGFVTVK